MASLAASLAAASHGIEGGISGGSASYQYVAACMAGASYQ